MALKPKVQNAKVQDINRDARLTQKLNAGQTSAQEIMRALSISQATFSRLIQNNKQSVLKLGGSKNTVYVAARDVRNLGSRFPIYVISKEGKCKKFGDLYAYQTEGFAFVQSTAKESKTSYSLSKGLPYFLSDSRPQGFIGRTFNQKHADLKFPKRLTDWSEADFLEAIATRVTDGPGNILVGRESFERYHEHALKHITSILENKKSKYYVEHARDSLLSLQAGSSAAGEQPKFLSYVDTHSGPRHVIVKYSPLFTTEVGRRWADLLICESLAQNFLEKLGYASAKTKFYEFSNQVFLEVERFDRLGERGRVGMISMAAVDDEWFGSRDNWALFSARALEAGNISARDAQTIRFLHAFGGLIANTDRHFGNLSFFYNLGSTELKLAPVYDMLPMLYAPVEGQIVEREFAPEGPTPESLEEWTAALAPAAEFWNQVATHPKVSKDFQAMAADNSKKINRLIF